MPTISMFFGIIVQMYYNDHLPPHFHARYQGHEAIYDLEGTLISGELPARQARIVAGWAAAHTEELEADWELARGHEELFRIGGGL